MRNTRSTNPIPAILGACALIAIVTLGGVAKSEEARRADAITPAVCGNEKVEAEEQCDLGTAKNGQPGELCSTDCKTKLATCGNNKLDVSEECDGGHQCDTICKLKAPVCGNGKQEVAAGGLPAEECDLGTVKNGMPGQLCSTTCTPKSKDCGNGKIDEGETCDWGPNNGLKDQQCSATCVLLPSTCGNKKIEIGEECDDGDDAKSGDGCNKCKLPGCGDGYADARLYEECDAGNPEGSDVCTATCCIKVGNWGGVECNHGTKAR